jgi:endonuclease G
MHKSFFSVVLSLVVFLQTISAQPDNSVIAADSVSMKHLLNLFLVGGRPLNNDSTRQVSILINHGYAVGYSEDRRNPLWSAYLASKVTGTVQPARYERTPFFYADTRSVSAVEGQTFGGGYDRGHMTPNFVISGQYGSLSQLETFFMTNMCPQKADLNQGSWQRLEKFVVDAAGKFGHVFVISGPIFGDNPAFTPNGPGRRIQIPDAFYMILVDTDREFAAQPTIRILAYRFPQQTERDADFTNRTRFGVSVNQIEAETKLDFFPAFNQIFADWENRENVKEMQHWTLD